MSTLILDIETFALADADQYLEPVSAPANYKDPVKIEQYCVERRAELLAKCALDADLCEIVAIGWHRDIDAECRVLHRGTATDEAAMLRAFWNHAEDAAAMVGFNLLSFDLPILIRRSQYLGLPVPPLNLDRYKTPHIDLMERLSFNGKIKAHSLDFYCRRFGIACDDTHSGADVDALVKAGEWEAIAAHCRADVEKTRALAARLGYVTITEPAEVY